MQSIEAVQEPLVQDRNDTIISATNLNEEAKNNKRPNCWTLKPSRTLVFFKTAVTIFLFVTAWLSVTILCPLVEINPSGIVQLMSMFTASYIFGQMCLMYGLPQVLPMYALGIAFRTYGFIDDSIINWKAFTNLRYLAVTVILLKGGIAADLEAVKSYPIQVLKSSFLICTSEALALTASANVFLGSIFPPLWTFVFGFVNAATSPTKFTNVMANLKSSKRYSNPKMQAVWSVSSSIEDIYCITVFSSLMSIVTRTSATDAAALILVIVCSKIALGFIAGTTCGAIVGYLSRTDDINSAIKIFSALWLAVISIYFGAKSYGWGPGGPLGTYVAGIAASAVWSLNKYDKKPVSDTFNKLWDWLMEPMLFSLAGFEIDLNNLPMSITDISFTIAALTIGYATRFFITIVVNCKAKYTFRETIFLAIAGLPKATVQAAIAPQLLDLYRGKEEQGRATSLLLGSIINVFLITTVATLFLHYFSGTLLRAGDKSKRKPKNNNVI